MMHSLFSVTYMIHNCYGVLLSTQTMKVLYLYELDFLICIIIWEITNYPQAKLFILIQPDRPIGSTQDNGVI
jgi:hypothetical protein